MTLKISQGHMLSTCQFGPEILCDGYVITVNIMRLTN
jgi:hypothetical protein